MEAAVSTANRVASKSCSRSRQAARVERREQGVDTWLIDVLADDGAFGLIKPTGREVQLMPVVRAINLPRNRLLAQRINEWTFDPSLVQEDSIGR
jgi:hypothetical protein